MRFSPFELLSVLVRRKRVIAGTVLGVMIVTALITLLVSNKYTSTATILPSGGADKMADLKNLAGLGSLTGSDEDNSALFPVILRSHTVRDAVLNREYSFSHNGRPMTVTPAEYFDVSNPDLLRRALASVTTINHDKKTGVITVSVETQFPAFSQAMVAEYLEELESYNLHKRRSEARERAKYLKRELAERTQELQKAEDSLSMFLSANRDWATATDPELSKLVGRLEREVEKRTQTYLYLAKEYEIAKLDAQKDVPIVRILDQPSLPTRKSAPKRTMLVLLMGMIAGVLAVFAVLVYEAVRRIANGPEKAAYDSLRSDLSSEFPRTNRVVNRIREKV